MEKTKKIATYVMVFAVTVVCLFQMPVYAPGSSLITEAEACSSVEFDINNPTQSFALDGAWERRSIY